MDSLRDEFPMQKDRSAAEVDEFLDGDGDGYEGLDLPQMRDLIVGWMQANSKVFGSAGEQVVGLVKGRLESLRSESPSTEESPTSGASSKTPSSEPSDSDSSLISSNP
jgi:hypothetical protein